MMKPSIWYIALVSHLMFSLVISRYMNVSVENNIIFKNQEDITEKQRASSDCADNSLLPVVKLLHFVVTQYFTACDTVVLYDEFFYESVSFKPVIMQALETLPGPIAHGQFSSDHSPTSNTETKSLIQPHGSHCYHYIVLTQTLDPVVDLLGYQSQSKVVLVTQSSQWLINDFLENQSSDQFINLLIVADPTLQIDIFNEKEKSVDINLYTHELYADQLGSRIPRLLTAWRCDRLTRPEVDLFPPKITRLNGYQLRIVAAEQPPYVYQKYELDSAGEEESHWDGLEVRLMKLISSELNFTYKFSLPTTSSWENTAGSVLTELELHRSDVALAGIHLTRDRARHFHPSVTHSHDCAVFMTLASTALPKYRAIMGPFRWEVWMTITLAYLFAILPISFSAHHTLRPLLNSPWELENMFWYVFGTFTNCFTFKNSWTSGKMSATRIFIGTYWVFSIIVSAAYTGSIIAFIMLPRFPDVMETPWQLVDNDIKLIITNRSDLKEAIYNSTDKAILRLSQKLKIVPTINEAVSNVTESRFFTHYAFLHSREYLKHIIRTNFTSSTSHKKSAYHLSKTCFVPILISMMFPPKSVLVARINTLLVWASQGGFIQKLVSDVAWDQQRTGMGKLLQVSGGGLKSSAVEERQLTLDDTQGMFLLMGCGFGLAIIALMAECCHSVYQKRCGTWWENFSSTAGSEHDISPDNRNFQFRSRDEFIQYMSSGSPTGGGQMELQAQIHVETSTVQPSRNTARSLTTIIEVKHDIKGRHLSL